MSYQGNEAEPVKFRFEVDVSSQTKLKDEDGSPAKVHYVVEAPSYAEAADALTFMIHTINNPRVGLFYYTMAAAASRVQGLSMMSKESAGEARRARFIQDTEWVEVEMIMEPQPQPGQESVGGDIKIQMRGPSYLLIYETFKGAITEDTLNRLVAGTIPFSDESEEN